MNTSNINTSNILDFNKIIEQKIESKLNDFFNILPSTKPNINEIYYNINDLTIAELYTNTLQTIIDIINDIIQLLSYPNKNLYLNIYNIFTKQERKLYVGIILIFFALILYFLDDSHI